MSNGEETIGLAAEYTLAVNKDCNWNEDFQCNLSHV